MLHDGLGDKLAILILQPPPNLALDPQSTGAFLSLVSSGTQTQIVCEPRHESWFVAAADEHLADLRVARVAADPAKVPQAALPGGWRGPIYMRLHGSPVMYRSAYGDDRLPGYFTCAAAVSKPGRCRFPTS